MLRSAALLALVVLGLASCASITPEQRAAMAQVQLLREGPPADCQNLGPASAGSDEGIRLKAVQLGANTVRLDIGSSSSGSAFYCPPPAAPRLPPPILVP